MKIFVLFLFLCFFVAGCQAITEDEVAVEETAEEIVEEMNEEEVFEAPLDLMRDLFGKTPEEAIEAFGEEPKYDEDSGVISFYEEKIGLQFLEGKLTYFLLFPEIKILDFVVKKDISEDDLFDHFGEPKEEGTFAENGYFYEYHYPEKGLILVFFFNPQKKESPVAVGVFKF